MALLPNEDWMLSVYRQAGEETRHIDTMIWQTFAIASAANAVLLNASSWLWNSGFSTIPLGFRMAPLLLGVFVSWAAAWSVWRSRRYAEQRYRVLNEIENDLAGQPWLIMTRLYTPPAWRKPWGPGVRPLMTGVLTLVGFGWLLALVAGGFLHLWRP